MLKINFLGDSITEGWGASSREKCYVSLVGKNLNAEVRNYGIAGTRIAKQIQPSEITLFDKYFIPRVKKMKTDADIVFVFGGTNDFGHGDAPLGNIKDYRDDTFYGALNVLIDELYKIYDKERVVFILPIHREMENNPYGNGSKKVPGATLIVYSNIIKEVCKLHNTKILDITEKFGPAGTDLYDDPTHPNDKGHEKLAKLITDYIKNEFPYLINK